jgi:hypothetical protein
MPNPLIFDYTHVESPRSWIGRHRKLAATIGAGLVAVVGFPGNALDFFSSLAKLFGARAACGPLRINAAYLPLTRTKAVNSPTRLACESLDAIGVRGQLARQVFHGDHAPEARVGAR